MLTKLGQNTCVNKTYLISRLFYKVFARAGSSLNPVDSPILRNLPVRGVDKIFQRVRLSDTYRTTGFLRHL